MGALKPSASDGVFPLEFHSGAREPNGGARRSATVARFAVHLIRALECFQGDFGFVEPPCGPPEVLQDFRGFFDLAGASEQRECFLPFAVAGSDYTLFHKRFEPYCIIGVQGRGSLV